MDAGAVLLHGELRPHFRAESDDSVSFVLPEITDDVTIEFASTYDENNIPIKLEEGSRINIDSDVGIR